MKKSPLQLIKKGMSTSVHTVSRLAKTASVAGLSTLRVAKGEPVNAELVRDAFMQMGVTYIKLGQFIASTPSIFPRDYVAAFADCLDSTPPVSFVQIREVLSAELGDIDAIFTHIDPIPIASASIAQVHKATLRDGRMVALKVQKPSVDTVISTDLGVLHGAFWALERAVPSMRAANLAPILDEIRTRMLAETNFIAESRHIERFLAFLRQAGITRVTAPTVHPDLTTKRVLTMDYLSGVSLVGGSLSTDDRRAQQAMSDVLDTWFMSVMMTGEFHADLHAGNLLLLDDGRIAFIDFGLVGQIDPLSLQACFMLVQAMQASDYDGMAKAMMDIGMTHEKERMDLGRLATDLRKMFGKMDKNTKDNNSDTGGADDLNKMMLELADIGKRHGIHFPRDFALLTKQLLYFDRFMLALAPEMELFGGARMTYIHEQTL